MILIDMCVCGHNFIHECSGLHHMLQEVWTVNVRVTYEEIYMIFIAKKKLGVKWPTSKDM